MEELKRKRGRPKGSVKQLGLSLDKRLKILSKIALDKNAKPTDVINACKEITSLLNDKIKDTETGVQSTVISFQQSSLPIKNIEQKPIILGNKENNLLNNIEKKSITEELTTTTTTAKTQNSLGISYIIEEDDDGTEDNII